MPLGAKLISTDEHEDTSDEHEDQVAPEPKVIARKPYWLGDVLEEVKRHGFSAVPEREVVALLFKMRFRVISNELQAPINEIDVVYLLEIIRAKLKKVVD